MTPRTGLLRQWPLLLVLAGVAIAMGFVAADRFRVGSVLLAAAVILAFAMRTVLPTRDVGWLAVRSRSTDAAVLGVLGFGLAVLALWVPPPSY